ncbi:MAG: hypothetical protein MUC44_12540 [Beijerinckiaceae bacterium]|jgi:hypothetical protein|nr:hypothetical protein [Beijerinckiaceae bacterium]
MLTALVLARSKPGALAVTLAALVPAVAEGLVSHAVVVLFGADADGERIADAMGATVIQAGSAPWREAATIARGEWVVLLEAGDAPDQGWITAIERHLLQQAALRRLPAFLPVRGLAAGLKERAALLLGSRRLRSGLIAPRTMIAAGTALPAPLRLAIGRQRLAD